jgi:hypothetical protein
MHGIGDIAHREHAAAGRFHIVVDDQMALGSPLEGEPLQPGVISVRLVAEQEDDVIDVDRAAVADADADLGAGLVERCHRLPRHHVRHPGRLMRAQALDQQRLRVRRMRAHDDGRLHALLDQHARDVEGIVAAADHRHMRAQIRARQVCARQVCARLPGPGRPEMQPATLRQLPRVRDRVDEILAAKSRSGRDDHGRARQ